MESIFYALFAMVLFGIGDSMLKLIKNENEKVILLIQYFFIFIFSIVFIFLFPIEFQVSWFLIFPFLAGIFEPLGILFLIKSIQKENLGISIAIASSYPLITFIFNFFVF